MYLSVEDCLAAISSHTEGLAAAADGHLDARIEHCPDWSMADLVWHLTSVHWFWNHVATTLPQTQPDVDRPARPDDDALLIPGLIAGMETLAATLRAADQDASCWTWGLEENVRFITRHQVQEAAVHHWDAANAVGGDWSMDEVAAMDAVEEFLTHSVGNRRWPKEGAEPIGGTIWFCPCIAENELCPTFVITDGSIPGTVALTTYAGPSEEIEGAATGDHVEPDALLLWLYRRRPDPGAARLSPRLVERFRALTYTD